MPIARIRKGKVRLEDVARLAAVSKTAAASVLTGPCKNVRVSPATARRIRHAAREAGYVPDRIAQIFTGGKTRTIGVICPDIFQESLNNLHPIIATLNRELRRHGYRTIMGVCWDGAEMPSEFVAEMAAYRVDGLVLVSQARIADAGALLRQVPAQTPVVAVHECRGFIGDNILLDRATAMEALVDLCVQRGHTRFAFLRPGPGHSLGKLTGIERALTRLKLPWSPERIVETDLGLASARAAADAVLALDPRPTCVMCSNDLLAVKLMRGLRQAGLRVPDDLSVTGFDDLETVACFADVPLTTVRQPREQMGREAARMLLARLDDPRCAPETVVLTPEPTLRQSMAAIRPEVKPRR